MPLDGFLTKLAILGARYKEHQVNSHDRHWNGVPLLQASVPVGVVVMSPLPHGQKFEFLPSRSLFDEC